MAQKDFHHPYQPYGIQQRFMEDVYGVLQDATGGIMESPTGTVRKFESPHYDIDGIFRASRSA